jgi:hypothetical protein
MTQTITLAELKEDRNYIIGEYKSRGGVDAKLKDYMTAVAAKACEYSDMDELLCACFTREFMEVKTTAQYEAEYTSHIIGQDNRNAAAMSSAFGTKFVKY